MINDLLLTKIVSGQFLLFDHPLGVSLSGYGVAIIISAVVLYALYAKKIFTRKIPPPISTWALWLLLDIVATCADLVRGIFNVQLVTYTVGTLVICVVLLKRRNNAWDMYWDTVAAAFVMLSIAGWLLADDATVGLVMALTGMTLATFPLLRSIVKGADEGADAWVVAVLGSTLGYLDGNVLSGVWLGSVQFLILCLIIAMRWRNVRAL